MTGEEDAGQQRPSIVESRSPGIPRYEVRELRPKESTYCLCVFVINEGQKLLKQLERIRAGGFGIDIDVVVADGGSDDGSTAPESLRELGVNSLLVKRDAGKLGTQMRMAFAWALDRGYEGVVVIDGNGKDGVDAIPAFVKALQAGVDHAQGSRFIAGGRSENLPFSRFVGVKFLHAPLMRWASGYAYTDTTNGFRAYSAALLRDPRVAIFRDVFEGYELHYYLAIQAAKKGFKVVEIPVARVYPATGKVPTKISPIRGNLNVLKKLIRTCTGGYEPVATNAAETGERG
ncbi:MAG TPA: glycosyltransferase family 2 protein [Pirellulaceae bacterium]|jgi:dolichol-phosphate mannosyltransferase|nr:glycosyltransferase family 2 protein [Pirellulaceae bacterium]